MTVETLSRVVKLWETSDNEDRQGLVRDLFSYIIYDLEIRRIVDFRLKPWADRFVTLRGAQFRDENKNAQLDQEIKRPMPHTGFNTLFVFPLVELATKRFVKELYQGVPYPQEPVNDLIPTKTARNMEICQRYKDGELMANLAQYYGISEQRVHQIVHGKRK